MTMSIKLNWLNKLNVMKVKTIAGLRIDAFALLSPAAQRPVLGPLPIAGTRAGRLRRDLLRRHPGRVRWRRRDRAAAAHHRGDKRRSHRVDATLERLPCGEREPGEC